MRPSAIISCILELKEGESIDLKSLSKTELLEIKRYAEDNLGLYESKVHTFITVLNREEKINNILK
jgi:hypothetical protein